jgi:hypothetical protein
MRMPQPEKIQPRIISIPKTKKVTVGRIVSYDASYADINVTKKSLLRLLKHGFDAFSSDMVETVRPFASSPG